VVKRLRHPYPTGSPFIFAAQVAVADNGSSERLGQIGAVDSGFSRGRNLRDVRWQRFAAQQIAQGLLRPDPAHLLGEFHPLRREWVGDDIGEVHLGMWRLS
jgi:hypothetical protein